MIVEIEKRSRGYVVIAHTESGLVHDGWLETEAAAIGYAKAMYPNARIVRCY